MKDDITKLLEDIHSKTIGGRRLRHEERMKVKEHEARLSLAVRDAMRIFIDGQWRPKSCLVQIARGYGVTWEAVAEICEMAEDDNGKLCIPGERTPEERE